MFALEGQPATNSDHQEEYRQHNEDDEFAFEVHRQRLSLNVDVIHP